MAASIDEILDNKRGHVKNGKFFKNNFIFYLVDQFFKFVKSFCLRMMKH
jgi:hypothetical protein